MRKALVLAAVVAAATIASCAPGAAADGPVKTFSQDVTLGFYRGQVVSYLDFGPVKLRPGTRPRRSGRSRTVTTASATSSTRCPGERSYTPLWAVRLVDLEGGADVRVLRSAAAVRVLSGAGT